MFSLTHNNQDKKFKRYFVSKKECLGSILNVNTVCKVLSECKRSGNKQGTCQNISHNQCHKMSQSPHVNLDFVPKQTQP